MSHKRIPPPEKLKELRCKLVSTGLRSKSQKGVIGVIRYLPKKDAEEQLKDRPIGSIILRLKKNAIEAGKSCLTVSYKYNTKIIHRNLKFFVKVSLKPDYILCKAEPKVMKFLQSKFFGFLDEVTVFINEFCNNKNFLERDISEIAVEKELTFRRYLIYPERTHITVLQKSFERRAQQKSVSVSIDFNECRFLSIKNSGEVITQVDSFNNVLLEFLNIRRADTFLVVGALGYNPKELKENVTRDRSYSFSRSRQLPNLEMSANMVSTKDMSSLIAIIDSVNGLESMEEFPDQVIDALSTIHSCIQILESPSDALANRVAQSEKIRWIVSGLFNALVVLICSATKFPKFSESVKPAIDIIKLTINNFPLACEALYQIIWLYYKSQNEASMMGISHIINETITVEPFVQLFILDAGVNKIVSMYTEISPSEKLVEVSSPGDTIEKRGRAYSLSFDSSRRLHRTTSSHVERSTIREMLKRAGSEKNIKERKDKENMGNLIRRISKSRIFSSISKKSKTENNNNTQNNTKLTTQIELQNEPIKSKLSPVPTLKIPPLNGVSYTTRSLRRRSKPKQDRVSLSGSTDRAFSKDITSAEELSDLARKLGETYMAADLTVMLSYKQISDVSVKKKKVEEEVVAQPNIDKYKSSARYQTKINLLKTLAHLAKEKRFISFSHSPTNLLFSELILSHKDVRHQTDEQFRILLYNILQSNAERVENIHINEWNLLTEGMTHSQKLKFRKKLDVFIWRCHNRIKNEFNEKNYKELEIQLRILGDYLRYCNSKVIANQIADVCLKTLLDIKKAFIHKRYLEYELPTKQARIIHVILRIFDEMALKNRFRPLNDLLLAIFEVNNDTWELIRSYAGKVLTDPIFEQKLTAETNGSHLIKEMRIQVIKHYKTIVDMIQKQFPDRENDEDYLKIFLLKKLEFLVFPPSTSIIQRYIQEGNQYSNYLMKKEMLKFLHKLFKTRSCPFTTNKTYVDSYISFHYMHFIKLYNNYSLDEPTLELCRWHLKILIDFSMAKNDNIKLKFYQLRAMDFLAHEISLEYEIKVKRKKFTQDIAKKEAQKKKNNNDDGNNINNINEKKRNTVNEGEVPKLKIPKHVFQLSGPPKLEKSKHSTVKRDKLSDGQKKIKVVPKPNVPKLSGIPKLNLFGVNTGRSSLPPLQKEPEDSPKNTPTVGKSVPKFDKEMNNEEFNKINWNEVEDDPELEVTNRVPGERRYTLTSFENLVKMSSKVMKWQVVLNRHRQEKIAEEEAKQEQHNTPYLLKLEEELYKNERDNRKLYADKKLHINMIELIFTLLLSPNGFTLEPLYTDQFPVTNRKINIPFLLWMHLNHPSNVGIIDSLTESVLKMNDSAYRLVKLLSTKLFQPNLYTDLDLLSEGAYGKVYSCKYKNETIAVKQMSVPRYFNDRCVLHDLFTEILVLDRWKSDDRICKIIDYGVDEENYWIVMKKYTTSLKEWRLRQKKSLEENLALYLNIYMEVLKTCEFLTDNNVNHYDIKCDNFLIDPINPDDDIYNINGDKPNFKVYLADFGESLVYTDEAEGFTTDNRGTEFIKSPEMLNIATSSEIDRKTYDRRKKVGANRTSDVWSIGCLLYELLTGEFMFYDKDWVKFWMLITVSTEELVSQEHKKALANNPHIFGFLQWVLIRDPLYRPTLRDVINRFINVRNECMKDIEKSRLSKVKQSTKSTKKK